MGLPLFFEDTPMALVLQSLDKEKYRFERATEEQLVRLEAIRRLLLQVDAIRAVSWYSHVSQERHYADVVVLRRRPESVPAASRAVAGLDPELEKLAHHGSEQRCRAGRSSIVARPGPRSP